MPVNSLEGKRKVVDALLREWEMLAQVCEQYLQMPVSRGKTLDCIIQEINILREKRARREAWSQAEEDRLNSLVSIPQNLSYARMRGRAGLVFSKYEVAKKQLEEAEAAWSENLPEEEEGGASVSWSAGQTIDAADPSAGGQLPNTVTFSHDHISKDSAALSRRRVPWKSTN